MSAKLVETLAAASAKLNTLAGTTDESAQVVTGTELVAKMAEELAAGVTKERAAQLAKMLTELQKNNWESTTWIRIKEVNDPTQLKPKTEPSPTIQQLSSGTPATTFSSNMAKAEKIEFIANLIRSPEAIRKGVYSDKFDELVKMFGLTEEDLAEEYGINWKVSDLVCQLQRAAKLEQLVEKSAPVQARPEMTTTWPLDMAAAKFDPVAKAYVKTETPWGSDKRS